MRQIFHRIASAAIMAGGVTLLAAGLLSYTAPPALGDPSQASPGVAARPSDDAPRDPDESRDPEGSGAPDDPDEPSSDPTADASGSPGPERTPRQSTRPSSSPSVREVWVVSRVAIPSLDIDLPVVPGDNEYPLCDVAQWLPQYGQPDQGRTVYLYAHAREGMFLPLLEESQRQNGRGMLGALVQVYTRDGRLHLYEVFRVKRHATDFSLADEVEPGDERLILQTSEGPRGTVPKLQVAARLLSRQRVDRDEAIPRAEPRECV